MEAKMKENGWIVTLDVLKFLWKIQFTTAVEVE